MTRNPDRVVERIGAIALFGEPKHDEGRMAFVDDGEDDTFPIHLEFFAELRNGRRIETDGSYGAHVISMRRRGLGAIFHRYYGPPVGDVDELDRTYRVRESDVRDAVNLAVGKDRFASAPERPLLNRLAEKRWERQERRNRWQPLRRTLAEHGIDLSVKQLDELPFAIEISDEVKAQLDYS